MQPTPVRLSQAIWTAFRAAKPIHHQPAFYQYTYCPRSLVPQRQSRESLVWRTRSRTSLHFFSDQKHGRDIEEKVEDAKDRIHESLDSRASTVLDAEPALKKPHEETIVHTSPESSSIVYDKQNPSSQKSDDGPSKQDTQPSTNDGGSDLPSQLAHLRSNLSTRFSHFMDNMQSQIFVASRRINDLTGYTGIERLKKEIEAQEEQVQSSRQLVKSTRAKYSDAISNRSATQREVNDLLHRKHMWSAQDLERFTSLYRSDHANEQAEQRAHQELSEAEVRYEEASTKLAKGILARYHEEQIWSDKIRQMSTWGTWGLMGLNVLLFVLLQLAIEPWRRKRLVRGFEEKVEAALSAREKEDEELRAHLRARDGNVVVQEAVDTKPEGAVVAAGEQLAEAVVDAITGATDDTSLSSSSDNSTLKTSISKEEIEEAAEQITNQELNEESASADTIVQIANAVPEGGTPDMLPTPAFESGSESQFATPSASPGVPLSQLPLSKWPSQITTSLLRLYSKYTSLLYHQFNETDHIVLSRKELTTKILESVVTGAALTCGVVLLMARSSR